jgi:hypothetical protein
MPGSQPRRVPQEQLSQPSVVTARHRGDQLIVVHTPLLRCGGTWFAEQQHFFALPRRQSG